MVTSRNKLIAQDRRQAKAGDVDKERGSPDKRNEGSGAGLSSSPSSSSSILFSVMDGYYGDVREGGGCL